jgi:hypothetical protein
MTVTWNSYLVLAIWVQSFKLFLLSLTLESNKLDRLTPENIFRRVREQGILTEGEGSVQLAPSLK